VTGFSVLVVCVGNVCRSPLAERVLTARTPAHVEVSSAGLHAVVGSAPHPETIALIEQHGGDAAGFAARQLTPAMVMGSDLVLTATKGIRSAVLEEAPGALRRTFTLLELAALLDVVDPVPGDPAATIRTAAAERSRAVLDDPDVPDPMGQPSEVHVASGRLVVDAVDRIAKGLAR
jgi:protein-tyrosine phosphatase